jgi:NTE family protein
MALCLSGGGFRAMLFHLGALWRINEAGVLPRIDQVSSVSGGSITAAVLGLHWSALEFDGRNVAARFVPALVEPLRRLAGHTIDLPAILFGCLVPTWISQRLVDTYQKRLFGRATLANLPDRPRFVFNAANLQTGALWRFSKEQMADWRVGRVRRPDLLLAVAVAASAAFPPVLSPLQLDLTAYKLEKTVGATLHEPPYTRRAILSDGGVYDNLGLETAWKNFGTVLVSDGGMKFAAQPRPWINWVSQFVRVVNVLDNQVRSLRKRDLIASYTTADSVRHRRGAYWGIGTDIGDYELLDALDCPEAVTRQLATVPTRLKALKPELQERIINWGYAVCDAALRRHAGIGATPPVGFPYPRGVR